MRVMVMTISIACVTLITGCAKTAKEGESASDEPKDDKAVVVEPVKTKTDSVSDDEDFVVEDDFDIMASEWKGTTITVTPKGSKANIEDYALAFCSKYDFFEPNMKILKFLANPKAYDEIEEIYRVQSDIHNGFIRSMLLTEVIRETSICYWNRKNGHSLVGVFMVNGHEGDKQEPAFMFYDYDPKTHVMTPDTEVSKVVEKVAFDKSYEDYGLELPQEGKDIVVDLYSDNGQGSYDVTEKLLKWNGDTFAPAAK